MELTELKAEMDQRFEETRQYIEQRITADGDQTRRHLEQRITGEVEQTRRDLEQRIAAEGEQTRRHFEERITAEGEQTRRHFDVVAEQMTSERNLSLDSSKATDEKIVNVSASNAAYHVAFESRLEDHEQRLSKLESE
jgi:hypothetical protein